MTQGVYCLTSPSGKRYVGIGLGKYGIEDRWRKYKKLQCKSQRALYNALKKYGAENFKYEIVLETCDADNAGRSEMYLIDIWNLQDDRCGYNIACGGKSPMLGRNHSEETKKKLSTKASARTDIRKGCFIKGVKFTKESREKIYAKTRGRKQSLEFIKKRIDQVKKAYPQVTIQNIKTQELVIGNITELAKKFNFSQSNLRIQGKAKGWILVQ